MSGEGLAEWFGDLAALQLRIAIVLALAWVTARALRRRSSSVEHRVWTLAVAAIVLLPVATMLVPAFSLAAAAPGGGGSIESTFASAPVSAAVAVSADVAIERAAEPPVTVAATVVAAETPAPWLAGIVGLWALGALVLGGRVLVQLVGARFLVAKAAMPTPVLAARLAIAGCAPGVRVRVLDRLSSPIVVGLVRPIVLLPREAESWPTARLRPVLLHELAHVDHGDARWLVLASIARAIAWIDPLVWWSVARLRRAAELAADDAVVAAGIDPHDYARELVEHARFGGCRPHALAPAILGLSLAERVAALLLGARPRARVTGLLGVPLALCTLAAVAVLAAVHLCDETRTPVSLASATDPGDAAVEHAALATSSDPTVVLRPGMLELRDQRGTVVVEVALDGVELPAEVLQGHLVVPLVDAFPSARLRVDADATIPWSTIVDVLYTAGRSGVHAWDFRVGDRWVSATPPVFVGPTAADRTEPGPALHLRVAFAGEHLVGALARGLSVGAPIAVHGDDGCSLAPRIDARVGAAEEQRRHAARACGLGGGHYVLQLAPAPDAAYGEVARTIAQFADVPACEVGLVLESGNERPLACDPSSLALDGLTEL